ncbi:MAG: molecular chaperone HtpG [Anaerolineaceae bacterium]|nr:molecular chaperone HtpG [Anaerolineaceae bacterium]
MTTNAEFQTPDDAKSFSFKAETKQLLNILIHSLYKEQEIFLREIISNASDALNRIRFEMLTDRNVLDPDAELCIRLSVDVEDKIITIQDTGIGMTKDELVENLGTIAQSGARAFLEATKEEGRDLTEIIGQFGVGFYSVFMVAEWVKITSRSYKPRAKAALWYATGEDSFQVAQAEKESRGTTIQIKLKEDSEEFANEMRIKEIIKRHSDYVGFPIYVGDAEEQVNQQTAIWRTSKQDLTDDEYKEFYRQLTLDFEEHLHHIHINTDAPLQVYSVLYIPRKSERGIISLRKEDGLKLYSKNVLIDEYSKDLLPEHFRFIQGVVDSEDLPLNVSRETIQATGMMARLKKILTGQVIRELESLAEKDAEKYQTFWQEFGNFIKQGVAMDHVEREKLYPLLRFKTNLHPDEWFSLDDYIGQMQDDQKVIYYIVGDDPKSVLRSPHLDYFRAQDVEVLLLTNPVDSFMLMGLQKYKDYEFKNVAQAELDVPEKEEDDQEKISAGDFEALIKMFKEQLGDKVLDVRSTNRLSSSVARLVDPESSLNPELQRVYRYLDREYEIPKKILELNPSHPILVGLCAYEGESDLTDAIVEQIYESALLVEGLHPDPSDIVARVQKIMQAALEK